MQPRHRAAVNCLNDKPFGRQLGTRGHSNDLSSPSSFSLNHFMCSEQKQLAALNFMTRHVWVHTVWAGPWTELHSISSIPWFITYLSPAARWRQLPIASARDAAKLTDGCVVRLLSELLPDACEVLAVWPWIHSAAGVRPTSCGHMYWAPNSEPFCFESCGFWKWIFTLCTFSCPLVWGVAWAYKPLDLIVPSPIDVLIV